MFPERKNLPGLFQILSGINIKERIKIRIMLEEFFLLHDINPDIREEADDPSVT